MSAFRPIAPSSSSSTAPDARSGGEDGLLPTAEGAQDTASNPQAGTGRARKRRAPSQVSQNACTNCKKARAKCDGQDEVACSRCVSRSMADSCHYEVHVKTVKEEMVKKIRSLEQQNAELQQSTKEKDHYIESVLAALKNNERGEEAIARLRSGQTYQQVAEWLGTPPFRDVDRLSPSTEGRLQDAVQRYEQSMRVTQSPEASHNRRQSAQWTDVTHNEQLTHHLMALYFAWVHPVHMLFSERHFMSSFRNGDSRYCSSALVNVMCAMGCFYMVDQGGDEADAINMRARFVDQMWRDVDREDSASVTFPATYAILFLVELSCGQSRKANSHLRLAVESLARVNRAIVADEACELAFWGIHTLNTVWASFTYQKPPAPISPYLTVFKDVELDKEDAMWQPYRFPSDNGAAEIPSHAIEVSREFSRLNQIIHETINVYCGSKGRVTARSIMYLYKRYLRWKTALPHDLAVGADGVEMVHPLPHVFYIHIHYHVALCQLFQPLLQYKALPWNTREHLYNVTTRSALDGLKILERYRSLFTNRYMSPMMAFCIVHICDIIIRSGHTLNEHQQRAMTFALESTHDALSAFKFVGPLQYVFCQTLEEEGLVLPDNVRELMGGRISYSLEEMLDSCERVTYRQPVDMLLERLDISLGEDFGQEWQQFIEDHGAAGMVETDIEMQTSSGDATPAEASGLPERRRSPSDDSSSNRSMQISSVVNS
ncbi:hypothetical protein K490DRAFT_60906 [Saccharata proteae CBS 121410]|uniref:Zn(2)-C6 fungal-type domain-containing protein n=1 Tax=Saccharata proteae CBS 121410 TaxID=1314787 RepID=A0A9P4LYD0_9PEZI|nr:hypothetical protein K490DRAFT_60906 [Saccharata proteae CBS 121410]